MYEVTKIRYKFATDSVDAVCDSVCGCVPVDPLFSLLPLILIPGHIVVLSSSFFRRISNQSPACSPCPRIRWCEQKEVKKKNAVACNKTVTSDFFFTSPRTLPSCPLMGSEQQGSGMDARLNEKRKKRERKRCISFRWPNV